MERAEILEKVQNVFRDVFDDDSLIIKEETNTNDLEKWDSLAQISIVGAIADEFHISPSIDGILAMKSVAKIIDIIQKSTK